jgi:glycosyltransferase involved in cell wall biosynthesis
LEEVLVSKKILIVTECFYPEEFKINDVALSWKEKGYDVDVLTLSPTYPLGKVFKGYKNKLFWKDAYHGINIFRVYAVTGYKDSTIKKILKYINFMVSGSIIAAFIGRKYDYIFGYNLGPLTDMLPAVVVRKLYKKPLMLWVQDVWPDSVYAYGVKKTKILSYFLNLFVKFIYHSVTSITISSKGFELKLRPYVKKSLNINYSPNWADDLNMDIESAALSKELNVHFTFAGNVGKVQNLENIINAFCLLPDNYQMKSQLNIVGDGSNLHNLKLLANNNPNIVFHGKQKRKDMSKFYKASDFLIVSLIDKPIFSITIPAKTQTYIAAKKPILAIIHGDVAEIVRDNNLGVCVDPLNVDLISKAFVKCIEMSNHEKDKFIVNNDKLLRSTFNKDYIINKMTNILVE